MIGRVIGNKQCFKARISVNSMIIINIPPISIIMVLIIITDG